MRIQILDDRTAADLFGSKAARRFHIIRVRLFNNLRERPDRPSVLVYSNSIELGVDLEKKYSKMKGARCARENSVGRGEWEKADVRELQNVVLGNAGEESRPKEHSCGTTTYRPLPASGVMQALGCGSDAKCQNVLSSAMSEIEEVAFGTDKSRVLFIPREPIQGVLPCHLVRVSGIHTECFISDIAILPKGAIILKNRAP